LNYEDDLSTLRFSKRQWNYWISGW
jgi:hypothetical protein